MSFLSPDKPKKAPPPPTTPTRADASVLEAGSSAPIMPSSSYIASGSTAGLTRKSSTQKPSLIGGV